MEQPRRIGRTALIAAAALLVGGLAFRRFVAPAPRFVEETDPAVPRLVEAEQRVTAEVLNGTSRRGLARLATRFLRRGGLDVVYFGTAATDVPRTEVLIRRGTDSLVAARVVRALGTGEVRIAPAPERRVDLTILLGADYRPPPTNHP